MRFHIRWLVMLCLVVASAGPVALAQDVSHYVFFSRDRERIRESSFLDTAAFEGAQIKYTWRQLEPRKDEYDFSPIREDLALLTSKGKRLFVQLQDVSFDESIVLVPQYLIDDPLYGGGADRQYELDGDDETDAKPAGWVSRRWDPEVQERFGKLLMALGEAFDGKIEGIVLPETAVSFGESGKWHPPGFTPQIYRDAIIANMTTLKQAFPRSVAMQYANFMPGEWLPGDNHGHLEAVYRRAAELGVGVGGPDLLPGRPGQMKHAYPLIAASAGTIPTGIAVQEGNYAAVDPRVGHASTIADLIAFARQDLHVHYIFWCTEEPYYSQKLIPYLRSQQPAAE